MESRFNINQNSWYVHTGIKNSIRDVLNWIYDIIKRIRDITNSNSWYVGLHLWDTIFTVIGHRGFYRSCAVIFGYRSVSCHGRENQRTVCNFSILNGRWCRTIQQESRAVAARCRCKIRYVSLAASHGLPCDSAASCQPIILLHSMAMIGYNLHHNIVCPSVRSSVCLSVCLSVCPSVCNAVHCGVQDRCCIDS